MIFSFFRKINQKASRSRIPLVSLSWVCPLRRLRRLRGYAVLCQNDGLTNKETLFIICSYPIWVFTISGNVTHMGKEYVFMKNVIMFTTQTWPHCFTAKKFLSQHKIHFVEKDINHDEQARAELIRRNVSGVPSFLIGDELIVGFDQARILQLVDHRVIECEKCQAKMRVPINKGTLQVTCPKCSHSFNT